MFGECTVGSLLQGLPQYVFDPPIEAVVFGFGVTEDGQLGMDGTGNVHNPKVLEALLGARIRGRGVGRLPLVAGSRASLAISADGDVFSWGWNARATLGHGHRDQVVPKPRRIAALRGTSVVQVALGGWHALYLDEKGHVWASGGDEYMQSGQGAKERDVLIPTRCLSSLRVCQVAAGGMHSLALTEDGQLWTWGEPWGSFFMTIDRTPRRIEVGVMSNSEDMAIHPRHSNSDHDYSKMLEHGESFVAIACGAFHNIALTSRGGVFSWGLNDYGQLGLGTTASVTAPQRIIEGLEGVCIDDAACGGWHSAVLSSDGEVFMFGRGEYGRLGLADRTGSSKLRPVRVKSVLEGYRVVQVSCGGSHTLAVTHDGKAWSWGRGSFGRLGTKTEKDAYAPVEVKLPGGPERWHVIAVAAGGRHSLCFALPDNGDLDERASSAQLDQSNGHVHRGRRSPLSGLSPQGSMAWMQSPSPSKQTDTETENAAATVTTITTNRLENETMAKRNRSAADVWEENNYADDEREDEEVVEGGRRGEGEERHGNDSDHGDSENDNDMNSDSDSDSENEKEEFSLMSDSQQVVSGLRDDLLGDAA